MFSWIAAKAHSCRLLVRPFCAMSRAWPLVLSVGCRPLCRYCLIVAGFEHSRRSCASLRMHLNVSLKTRLWHLRQDSAATLVRETPTVK